MVFICSDHSNTLNKLFSKNLSDQAVTIGTTIERCKPSNRDHPNKNNLIESMWAEVYVQSQSGISKKTC